jgi:hypothetical protein
LFATIRVPAFQELIFAVEDPDARGRAPYSLLWIVMVALLGEPIV